MKMKSLLLTIAATIGITALSMAQNVPNYVPTNGLIGWWPFNGNANDESGNGNNGTINGATFSSDRFGNIASSVQFQNSTSQYISADIGLQDTLSISIWYSCNSQSKYYPTLIDYGNSTSAALPITRYIVHIAGQEPSWINTFTGRAYIQTNVGNIGDVADTEITTNNNWHNLVCIFIPGDASYLYIDGIYKGSDPIPNVSINSGSLFIGRDVTDNAGSCFACGRYQGLLDDIAIYNRALTQQEITSLYTSTNSACSPLTSITLNAQNSQSSITNASVMYMPNSIVPIADTSQWHYIALTKSGLNGNFYIDGNLVFSSNFVSNPYIWNSLLLGATQGCVSCSPVPNFNGLIDEVRVSNVARSLDEISAAFNLNQPFFADNNTIGLFHIDNLSGNNISNVIGGNASVFGNPLISAGKFGQAMSFDGVDDYVRWNNSIPVNNMSVEFWVKSADQSATMAMLEYAYNTGISLSSSIVNNPIQWSTGDTTNSITINPAEYSYVWVSNGNCTDTILFNSTTSTVYDTLTVENIITVYDTVTTLIAVTDTLIINTLITDLTPAANTNVIKVFPNPTGDILTIDYGNFIIMNGYQLSIENSLGQEVFQTNIIQQSDTLNLSNWGGNGLYFVHIIDPQGNTIDIRKIVLQ